MNVCVYVCVCVECEGEATCGSIIPFYNHYSKRLQHTHEKVFRFSSLGWWLYTLCTQTVRKKEREEREEKEREGGGGEKGVYTKKITEAGA